MGKNDKKDLEKTTKDTTTKPKATKKDPKTPKSEKEEDESSEPEDNLNSEISAQSGKVDFKEQAKALKDKHPNSKLAQKFTGEVKDTSNLRLFKVTQVKGESNKKVENKDGDKKKDTDEEGNSKRTGDEDEDSEHDDGESDIPKISLNKKRGKASSKTSANSEDSGSSTNATSNSTNSGLITGNSLSTIAVQGYQKQKDMIRMQIEGDPDMYLGQLNLGSVESDNTIVFKDEIDTFFTQFVEHLQDGQFDDVIKNALSQDIPEIKLASEVWKVGIQRIVAQLNPSMFPNLSACLSPEDHDYGNLSHTFECAKAIVKDATVIADKTRNVVINRQNNYTMQLSNMPEWKDLRKSATPGTPHPYLSDNLPTSLKHEIVSVVKDGKMNCGQKVMDNKGAIIMDIVDQNITCQERDIYNANAARAKDRALSVNEFRAILESKLPPNINIDLSTTDEKLRTFSSLLRPTNDDTTTVVAALAALPKAKNIFFNMLVNMYASALNLYTHSGSMQEIIDKRIADIPNTQMTDTVAALSPILTSTTTTDYSHDAISALSLSEMLASQALFPYVRTKIPINRAKTAIFTPSSIVTTMKYVWFGLLNLKSLYHDPHFCTVWTHGLLQTLMNDNRVATYSGNWHPNVAGMNIQGHMIYDQFPFLFSRPNGGVPANNRNTPSILKTIINMLNTARGLAQNSELELYVNYDHWRLDRVPDGQTAHLYTGGIEIPMNGGYPIPDQSVLLPQLKAVVEDLMKYEIFISGQTRAGKNIGHIMKTMLIEMGSSVVIALGVVHQVGRSILRAGILPQDVTNYKSVAPTNATSWGIIIEGSKQHVVMRQQDAMSNPTLIGSMLVPLFVKYDESQGAEMRADAAYNQELCAITNAQNIMSIINMHNFSNEVMGPILALVTASQMRGDNGPIGNMTKYAMGGNDSMGMFCALMNMIRPGVTQELNVNFQHMGGFDWRGDNVFLAHVDPFALAETPGFRENLQPDNHMMIVLEKIVSLFSRTIMPNFAPQGTMLTLGKFFQSDIPQTIEDVVYPPADAFTIQNLSQAINVEVIDGDGVDVLWYSDSNGIMHHVPIKDLCGDKYDRPLHLVVGNVGTMTGHAVQTLEWLVKEGRIVLYLSTKKTIIKERVVEQDTYTIRRAISSTDEQGISAALLQSDNSVIGQVCTRRVVTPEQGAQRISTPLTRYLRATVQNAEAPYSAKVWTDYTNIDPFFRKEMWAPTQELTLASIRNPRDIYNNVKDDVYPLCFTNPTIRLNDFYYMDAGLLINSCLTRQTYRSDLSN